MAKHDPESVEYIAHDSKSVEYMARLLCVARGSDPDRVVGLHSDDPGIASWHFHCAEAIRALDYMAARGEKVTTPQSIEFLPDTICVKPTETLSVAWAIAHDAAPMTPRDK